jgi:TetR/AcrR family transcriptional regulator, cholesterol catabolism regulator
VPKKTKAQAARRAERRDMSADERRQQIIDKAAALFDSESYSSTSMDDIAAAVGIAKPTLYHYFPSKGQILFDIHEELIDRLLARHEERVERNPWPRDWLLEIMEDILEFMETRPGHMRVFFEHLRELPEKQRDIIRMKRENFQAILEHQLGQGVKSGDFREMDVRLTSFEIFGACIWAYQWYEPGGRLQTHEIARYFWNTLIQGIGAPTSQ